MSKLNTKVITGVKYIYLIVFFALLAGFFHPIITDTSFDNLITGTLVLFIGLAGGVLVYKAITSESKRGIFFWWRIWANSHFPLFHISDDWKILVRRQNIDKIREDEA